MAEIIINLRTRRKERDRALARAEGDARAAKFGQTKAERAKARMEARLQDAKLDNARLDPASSGGSDVA